MSEVKSLEFSNGKSLKVVLQMYYYHNGDLEDLLEEDRQEVYGAIEHYLEEHKDNKQQPEPIVYFLEDRDILENSFIIATAPDRTSIIVYFVNMVDLEFDRPGVYDRLSPEFLKRYNNNHPCIREIYKYSKYDMLPHLTYIS